MKTKVAIDPAARPLVVIVDDDETLQEFASATLEREGFRAVATRSRAEVMETVQQSTPDAIVIDVELPDGIGYEIVRTLREREATMSIPVVMVSSRSGFVDKVESIHCGADGFFEKPIDWPAVARRLNHLISRRRARTTARILFVEDNAVDGHLIRTTLERVGHTVHGLSDPTNFEHEIAQFRPDLVILDALFSGGISGFDLARYMRQSDAFATTPIIMLTSEAGISARVASLRAGTDDHIIKPIEPILLTSAVAARLERSAVLRELVERDGLTGVLTHSSFMSRAKAIVDNLGRRTEPLAAFVMLDLDLFKRVNDQYGHAAGDRILVDVGVLLRNRLRQIDLIGRYGGEEFAVILQELDASQAERLIQRLLDEFTRAPHRLPDGNLVEVSFSAGIAMYDPSLDLARWRDRADNALYQAKAAGRHRVIVYDPTAS